MEKLKKENDALKEANDKLQEERDQLIDAMGGDSVLTLKEEYEILKQHCEELEGFKQEREKIQKRLSAAEQGWSLFAHEAEVWEMRFDNSKERNKILEEENKKLKEEIKKLKEDEEFEYVGRGDETLDRWVEENYGEDMDWEFDVRKVRRGEYCHAKVGDDYGDFEIGIVIVPKEEEDDE